MKVSSSISALAMLMLAGAGAGLYLPSALAGEGPAITQSMMLVVPEATLRTPEAMMQAERANPTPPQAAAPFRPTMGDAAYLAAKAAAARSPSSPKPGAERAPLAPPVPKGLNINGANQNGLFPPDTHGAVGKSQFVEVTNSHLDIYRKTDGVRVNGCATPPCPGVSLASFFGYTAQTLFDPRAVYDSTYGRFIITAEAFRESATVQRFFIAISRTSNPLGSYFIYNINADFFGDGTSFFDFPQLGMDQDAIIFTANIFQPSGFVGADLFAVAKARLYNGLGFFVPVFTGLCGTLAPPIVLDQNARDFLVCAPQDSSTLFLYTLRDSSRAFDQALFGPASVPLNVSGCSAYSAPPSAPQPGSANSTEFLDTGDSRFVNASTQIGNALWQVHTINFVGFATPRYYKINTTANTVDTTQSCKFFFATGSSHDFNASIAANSANDVYVTWSVTDPGAGTNAQIRASGKRSADTFIPGGSVLFTSPTKLTGNFDSNFGLQRWGDYSAVSVDPVNSLQAWTVNEKINTSSQWGSGISKIGF